jgi:hypothetical protein
VIGMWTALPYPYLLLAVKGFILLNVTKWYCLSKTSLWVRHSLSSQPYGREVPMCSMRCPVCRFRFMSHVGNRV